MKHHEIHGFPIPHHSSPSRFLVFWIVLIVFICATIYCVVLAFTFFTDSSPPRDLGVMFGFNAEHTHVIAHERILSAANVSGLVPSLMTGQAGPFLGSSPIVANGVVYIGSEDGKLYAYKATGCGTAKECQPLWFSEPAGGKIDSAPAIIDGKVYIGSMDRRLYVYNASGCGRPPCAPLWISKAIGEPGEPMDNFAITTSPVVADGIVYVTSHDGKLYAYSTAGCGKAECSFLWN